MATCDLFEMLNAAIETPHMAAVNFAALHKLLKAIIGQLDQQQLSVVEPRQSPTPSLAKDQDTIEQRGREKEDNGALGMGQQPREPEEEVDGKDMLEGTGSNSKVTSMAKEAMPETTEEKERDVSKKRASLQDLWEEITKLKEVQSGLAEDMRAVQEAHSGMEQDMQEMKEAMQNAHSGMEQDMRDMKEAMQNAHSGMEQDMREMKEAMQNAHSGMEQDMREMKEAMQNAHSGMEQDMREMKEAMQNAHSGMEQDMRDMKEAMQNAHSGMEQDMRDMKEAMQNAHSGLAEDIQEVKDAHSGLAEDMHALQEAHSGLAEDIQEIQETLGLEGSGGQSAPAEPTQVALDTQPRKSSALGPKGRETQPGMETSKGTPGSGSPGMQARTQGEPVTPVKLSGAPSDHTRSIDASATTSGMQPGSLGTQASTSGMQPGSPGTHATTPGVQPGSSRSQATIPGVAQGPTKPWGSSGSTITSSYESEMREVLSQVGELGHRCAALEERVDQLKSAKAERADLENVRRLFPKGGRGSITSILADLQCQVSFLQDMARALQGEKEKVRKVEDAPRKMRGAGASRKADGSGQMTQQLRPKGQKVKEEQKELGKQQEPTQAELEQFAAKYTNELAMETAEQLQAEELDEPRATAHSGGQEQAECPDCNSGTRVLLGKLLQRCEKLEEQVESLSRKVGGKVESYPKWRRQSLQQDEQLKCLQANSMQLQKDYEKLSSAVVNLQRNRQQEQNDIKALSQALERLKKQNADEEDLLVLAINEKADIDALAEKVNRSQFEASMEQLKKTVGEVTSWMMGQEKGWHRFQQELQRQMDCKLDRRELGAFRQQQEERWKSLREQLQKKALQPEGDNAAGIRKQLLPGLHCLSCDRPQNMLAPGPERTGECRYPTIPRSCGGPHTLTPPRFQPQPPSTPRPSSASAHSPRKKDAMQLTGQEDADGKLQNKQPPSTSMTKATAATTTPKSLPSILAPRHPRLDEIRRATAETTLKSRTPHPGREAAAAPPPPPQ